MASGTSKDKPTPKGFIAVPRKQDPVEKLIQNVTNRYRVTAREARDIITAAGTVASTKNTPAEGSGFRGTSKKTAVQNLKKQIVETGKAAVTGKAGTSSDTMGYPKDYKGPTDKRKSSGGTMDNPYVKGAKRK